MSNPGYDTIGIGYTKHRKSDPRIVDALYSLLDLPSGSIIADIGAGTGNYSRALTEKGYKVKAIEPSSVMREQSQDIGNVEWIEGYAENIPLDNSSVDGVVVVLAIHHFTSFKAAADEMYRICPTGPIVIFTCDPRESEEFWFTEYFSGPWQHTFKVFPPIDVVIQDITEGKEWVAEKVNFPLPHDLTDKFMIVGWRTPEIYLDPTFRQGASGFALAAEGDVNRGVQQLRNDIENGDWDRKYGYLKQQGYFDAGFRFLRFKSKNK